MVLAVDAGNTLVKMALVSDTGVVSRACSPAADCVRPADLIALSRTAIGQASDGVVRGVVVSSVVPRLWAALAVAFRRAPLFGDCDPLWVRHDLDLGITVATRHPERVGSDRIADAVATADLLGCPAVVVSCGTALTVTVLDAARALVGGAIAPGPAAAARCLGSATGQLPIIEIELEPECDVRRAIGRDTDEAIRAGILHGAIGGLRSIVRSAWDELGTQTPVALTGGYADALGRCFGLDARVVPDLTFHGLRLIADRNLP
jgi:type III pantothenate kinase